MSDAVPRFQLGYVLPRPVGDYIHYQFYRISPPGCLLVGCPLDLKSFSQAGADAAMAAFWPAVDTLASRHVDRISQGGIPISAFVGRPKMLEVIDAAEQRTGIACSADFEEAITGLRSLGVGKIAIAAKWDRALIDAMKAYIAHAGLAVVGAATEARTAQEVAQIVPEEGLALSMALGRSALQDFPEAEGVLMGGGGWLSMPALPRLEREFGKPVVSNPAATYWAALQQFKLKPAAGWGRLLDSLP